MSTDDKLVTELPRRKPGFRARPALATDLCFTERIAGYVLNGPLTLALILLCGFQLASWIPHYLTWPWFADHDVFATLALGWEHGQLPYRDLAGNNFPGSIYLFWIVGKLFGWGRTVPFYALDASFVLIFGATLLLWSRRRFGRCLPGVVGFAVFLTYYLGRDFDGVAQRDWHGPFFILWGLLLAEAYPGRWSRGLAAASAAVAFSVRPQVVLFLPALAHGCCPGCPHGGRVRSRAVASPFADDAQPLLRGGTLLALFVVLAFLPLVLAGIFDDFLHGIRLTFYGSRYNSAHSAGILKQMLLQSLHMEFDLVPLGVLVLASLGNPRTARTAHVWLLAYLGAWFYKPLSPVPFPYLELPLRIVCAINMALLVELLLSAQAQPALRLVAVLLAVGLGVHAPTRDVQRRVCPPRRRGPSPRSRPRSGASRDVHRTPRRSQGARLPLERLSGDPRLSEGPDQPDHPGGEPAACCAGIERSGGPAHPLAGRVAGLACRPSRRRGLVRTGAGAGADRLARDLDAGEGAIRRSLRSLRGGRTPRPCDPPPLCPHRPLRGYRGLEANGRPDVRCKSPDPVVFRRPGA